MRARFYALLMLTASLAGATAACATVSTIGFGGLGSQGYQDGSAVNSFTLQGYEFIFSSFGDDLLFKDPGGNPGAYILETKPAHYQALLSVHAVDGHLFSLTSYDAKAVGDAVGVIIGNSSDVKQTTRFVNEFDWQTESIDTTFAASIYLQVEYDGRSQGVGLDNIVLTSAPAAVLEPSSWVMFLAGFAVVGCGIRHRRRTAVSFG